jgi:hypothetical protein
MQHRTVKRRADSLLRTWRPVNLRRRLRLLFQNRSLYLRVLMVQLVQLDMIDEIAEIFWATKKA